jgi:hypothetical protein
MREPINVKSPNNTSEWQMGFNSAFKGLIRYLVYVTLCMGPSSVQVWMKLATSSIQICTLDGHLHGMTYTRYHINTVDSPDDEHKCARNMQRIEINIYENKCASSWLFTRIEPLHCVSGHSLKGNI